MRGWIVGRRRAGRPLCGCSEAGGRVRRPPDADGPKIREQNLAAVGGERGQRGSGGQRAVNSACLLRFFSSYSTKACSNKGCRVIQASDSVLLQFQRICIADVIPWMKDDFGTGNSSCESLASHSRQFSRRRRGEFDSR